MKCFLTAYNILMLSVLWSICVLLSNAVDLPVLPIQQPVTQFYISLNESFCQVNHELLDVVKPYFVYNMTTEMINSACDGSRPLDIETPDYILSNMDENAIHIYRRQCPFKNKNFFSLNCRFNFNRKKNPAEVTTENNTDSINSTTTTLRNSDDNFFIYIAAGVALTVVIALQITCIVVYSRKVKSTSTTLTNMLRRRSGREDVDRYSQTPVVKKTSKDSSKTDEEENVYESLEILAANKAKIAKQAAESDTDIFNRIKERPPLPLPAQIPTQEGDVDSMQSYRMKQRPPMPLPNEMQLPGMEIRTLPSKASQNRFNERLPDPPVTSATLLRPRPRPMPSPILRKPIPHKPSPHTTPQLGLAERFAEPAQTNSIKTLPRHEQTGMSKIPGSGNIVNELTKVLLKKQNPFPSNPSLHQPQAPLSRTAPTTKQPTTPAFHPLPPPPNLVDSRTNGSRHSSDDEWTYEKLPPIKNYLR